MALILCMTVDLYMAYILISMTLTLMQGHSGLAGEHFQRLIISTTKQAISMLGYILFRMALTFKTFISLVMLNQPALTSCVTFAIKTGTEIPGVRKVKGGGGGGRGAYI